MQVLDLHNCPRMQTALFELEVCYTVASKLRWEGA